LHVANGLVNMCQIEDSTKYASYLNMTYIQKLGLVDHLDEWTTLTHELLRTTN